MGCSGLLILGLVLNVAHCLEILGPNGEPILEITHNTTAVLGEDVYLRCRYLGESQIENAVWRRQISSKIKSKGLAGFLNNQPFSREDFSNPDSLTNLTVKMSVSSVDVEGEYICEFDSAEGYYSDSVFLTVIARPDIQILVDAETINGSHFQSVSCSAVGGRPMPQISWLVNGLPPSDYPFTFDVSETVHSNGTSTLSSILRFPTHLQDVDSMACVVQHPTLPSPKLTKVRVETYTRPNVTIKAEMVQQGGSEFWVVPCISTGGRPGTDVSLALNTTEELQSENNVDSDTQTCSVLLPATMYEGRNVTCVFDHPKFAHKVSQVITLPSFYLSGVQVLYSELESNSDNFQDTESLELQEGQRDTVIRLQIIGNVPRYNGTCRKDDGPLPQGVELLGSSLTVQGPVGHQHAGQYECFYSYHHLQATLKFNVTVKPQILQPIPPTIRVDLQTEDGHRMIECSAADAVPAANMSWLLPEARLNINLTSSTEWKDGDEYTKADCSVDSVAPAATITWCVGNSDNSISYLSETDVRADGLVLARSSVHFLSSLYRGQNLTCMVKHQSLEALEKRTIRILVHKSPQLNVSVVRPQDSPLWLAVCDCRGEGVGTNLAWVLPENANNQTFLHSEYEGLVLKARLTYQFPLALHEGQDLTCVYHIAHGATERRTIHIPRYHISTVRVLNRTTPLQSRYAGEPIIHRLTLQENHHNQRVLLRVEGNVPEYNLDCKRSDGSFVQMEGVAMLFQSELTEQDEGLYTCQASFYHHTSTVNIQVEFMSKDKLFPLVAMVCISSASAIVLIVIVTLWVCCKGNSRTKQKKQESFLALTTLMQEPSSPEVKKPKAMEKDSKEYAQLISYSIVIDVKTTV